MFTVSASKIKTFDTYAKGSWGGYDSVVTDIMGIKKKSTALNIGSCVDAYINDMLAGGDSYDKLSTKLGLFIHEDGIEELNAWGMDFKKKHPTFTIQPKSTKIYTTKYGDLAVTLMKDIVYPGGIKDVKTSAWPLSKLVAGYISDIQGLLYLDDEECDLMEYEHFKVSHATNRVKYEGIARQAPASSGYITAVLNNFMEFVMKNELSVYIDRPEVYKMDTIIFSPKHFHKSVAAVLKEDPGYIKWMMWAGYKFDQEVKEQIN